MKNRAEAKIRIEVIKSHNIDDEFFFRDLARKIVSDMPMNELHKLMKFTKIDPFSEESDMKMSSNHCSDFARLEKAELFHLRGMEVVLFKAECNLPDKD